MPKITTLLRGTNFCTCLAQFAPSFVSNQMVPNAPKWYETQQNLSLGSNGVDRVRSLPKILTRLRGSNFCTSSDCFATSFVRQPKGTECTRIVRNAPKRQFWVLLGGSGAFVAKNSDATSWHELLHFAAHFAPSFLRQPNGPGCTQIVRHTPKCQFRVEWGGSGAFVAKNYYATSWHELLH